MSLGRAIGNRGLRHLFPVYDFSFYPNKPWFMEMALIPATDNILYAVDIFEGTSNTELPIEATFRSLVAAIAGEPICVIDIESYPTSMDDTDPDIADSVSKLVTIVGWAKNERPDLTVGTYALMPNRQQAVAFDGQGLPGTAFYDSWVEHNDKFSDLVDAVDALFPSIYTFNSQDFDPTRPDFWSKYISRNIAEAYRMAGDKPVYPFMWPQYHGSNQYGLAGTFIDSAFWLDQLDLVASLADGISLWGANPNNLSWNWWDNAMVDFLVSQ